MFNRLYLSSDNVSANAANATIDPTLDLCTRYPLWLGGPRQCGIQSLPDTSTHGQHWESNRRPSDPESNALSTGPHAPTIRYINKIVGASYNLSIYLSIYLYIYITQGNPSYCVSMFIRQACFVGVDPALVRNLHSHTGCKFLTNGGSTPTKQACRINIDTQ